MDLTATDAAQPCGLSVRPANALHQRIRGKRGCGAGGKTIVLGLLKRGECVYTRQRHRVFWSHAKHQLAQFHGVRRDKFALHLKETELRFNHCHLDLYKTLLEPLRDESL